MVELTVDNIKNNYRDIEILDDLRVIKVLHGVALNYRSFMNHQKRLVKTYKELKITRGTLRKFKVIYRG